MINKGKVNVEEVELDENGLAFFNSITSAMKGIDEQEDIVNTDED